MKICLLQAIIIASAIGSFCGCGTTKDITILSSPVQPPDARDILDLPVSRVEIRGYRMQEALAKISEAVRQRSGGSLHFYYGLASSKSRIASQTAHPWTS